MTTDTTNQLELDLQTERQPKMRTGLYIEEALMEQVRGIAAHNSISVNEALTLLIKRGMKADQ